MKSKVASQKIATYIMWIQVYQDKLSMLLEKEFVTILVNFLIDLIHKLTNP